jgi:two-component system cell cycle sensor histidine kinase/response regulator CckA
VQVAGVDILWAIAGGTLILLTFAVGYIVVTVNSHQKVVQAQRARLEEVSRSELKYRGLFDNSLAGIMSFSVDTWMIYDSNEAIKSLFGCSSQEELQSCISNLPTPSLWFIRQSLMKEGFITEQEIHTTRRDGMDLWLLFSAKTTDADRVAQAVIVNITKRKHYEEKIREQSALLDQTQDAIIVVDDKGMVTFWNSGAELMYGWAKEEVGNRAIGEFLYAESMVEEFQAALEDIRQFNEWNGEQYHRRKDGKQILVESRWRTVERSTNGKRSILMVNSDITEKRRLESQFIRAQKMESIALLTGGIAHDLQNVLAPVAMSIPLLRRKLSDQSSLAILQAVETSARGGLELVRNILTYGRGIAGERVALNVSQILDQVLDIVKQSLPESVRIERKGNGHGWCVSGDMNQLRQVFLNLCVNARDVMPAGGLLTVESADIDADEGLLDFYPDADPGPYVVVSVSDTGTGIREEDLDRIFEPFFTTKEQGEGTGLGLSIAHGIVKSHKGYITVRSVIGRGTTFRVYLPAIVDTEGQGTS